LGSAPWADEVRRNFRFAALGSMASQAAPHITGSAAPKAAEALTSASGIGSALPVQVLTEAVARGARIIYPALGTMALKDRWEMDLGAASGGNLPPGTTGKAFSQHVWRSLFSAMRELGDGYHCVVCVGTRQDALDFLEGDSEESRLKAVPDNVSVRTFVQQNEMLGTYANAFISHAGFNSMQESLVAGVPLISVPQAIDQPANARKIEASGWGRAFLRPMQSVSGAALAEAVREVSAESGPYHAAVAAAGAELCGGEGRAADLLLELALGQ